MVSQKHLLNIITPVSRPQNLPLIQPEIQQLKNHFAVDWYCIADSRVTRHKPADIDCIWSVCENVDRGAGVPRNMALNQIYDGWVFFLDDDNLVHPAFHIALSFGLSRYPKAIGHIFSQVDRSGKLVRVAKSENMVYSQVDMGQFVVRRSSVGNCRFPRDVYCSDWTFLNKIWEENQSKFEFHGPATYFNALSLNAENQEASV